MSFDAFWREISERGIRAERDLALANTNTFRIGGTCRIAAFPKTEQELCEVITLADGRGLPIQIMGKGSNCLVYDGYIDKIIIFTQDICRIDLEGDEVSCGAGVSLVALAKQAAQMGLGGLEFACGIPGSIGGAVYMNAGAHGGTMADVLVSSRAFDRKRSQIVELSVEEHGFDYRKSVYMHNADLVCLGVTLKLYRAPIDDIKQKMTENMQKRRSTQPIEAFSAGSYFKRPEGDAAGRLIDVCGLKGFSIGGARVSEKHAGFVVNTGEATFEDVLRLEEHIVRTVCEQTGVTLKREVEIIR